MFRATCKNLFCYMLHSLPKGLFGLGSGFEEVDLRWKCMKSLVVWIKGKMVREELRVYKSLWVMW